MTVLPGTGAGIPIYLDLHVRSLEVASTLAINERCAELRRQGRRVYRFGLGQSPFPVPLPVVEALKANAFQKDYLPVRGLFELRQAIADYHRRTHHIPRTADDVLIGPGTKPLMFLLQLVYYGDLLVPTPAWVSYAPQAVMLGRRVEWIPTSKENHWKLRPEVLDELCWADPQRPRILVLNYPNNPTGLSYSPQELEQLAEVARRYSLVVLSDEIYGELHHQAGHLSIARYYHEGTVISSGLSKWLGAGGWRLGAFSFPRNLRWLLEAMAVAASQIFTSTCAPVQYAAVRAFQGGSEIEHYLMQARRILRALGSWCAARLTHAGLHVPKPEGGFYVFPDFSDFAPRLAQRGIRNSRQLAERLLEETGVATLPGVEFGLPPSVLALRIAYVDFDGGHALTAAASVPASQELDEDFLKLHCATVMEGVEKICDWLHAQ